MDLLTIAGYGAALLAGLLARRFKVNPLDPHTPDAPPAPTPPPAPVPVPVKPAPLLPILEQLGLELLRLRLAGGDVPPALKAAAPTLRQLLDQIDPAPKV